MVEWKRITRLSNPQEKRLLANSKFVYEALFPPDEREPWENFATYIRDTEERRAMEYPVDPEDHYYVGTVGDMVWGMMFFTSYPGKLGFVAYMGVAPALGNSIISPQDKHLLVNKMPDVITSAMNAASCSGYLFELEKVAPEDLSRSRSRHALTALDYKVRERINITNAFQRKGTRKLGWVTYRQPKLEWDREDQEISMHLMYAATSKFSAAKSVLDRREVMRYIEFVYLTFYMDGFEATEGANQAQTTLWREYLVKLSRFALERVPKTVLLQVIDLSSPKPSVFISYSQEDLRLAQLAQEYLESLGIPVFCWERGRRLQTGQPVWDVIERWMTTSKNLLFVLTKNTEDSPGQLREIEFVKEHRKRVGQVIPLFTRPVSPKALENWFGEQLIGRRFGRTSFCEATEEVGAQIIGMSKQ